MPEVRNWAALSWLATAVAATRCERRCGSGSTTVTGRSGEAPRCLARRRDRRAAASSRNFSPATTRHVHTFNAAAFLHEPALLPLLAKFNALDPASAGAVRLRSDGAHQTGRPCWQLSPLVRRWPEAGRPLQRPLRARHLPGIAPLPDASSPWHHRRRPAIWSRRAARAGGDGDRAATSGRRPAGGYRRAERGLGRCRTLRPVTRQCPDTWRGRAIPRVADRRVTGCRRGKEPPGAGAAGRVVGAGADVDGAGCS